MGPPAEREGDGGERGREVERGRMGRMGDGGGAVVGEGEGEGGREGEGGGWEGEGDGGGREASWLNFWAIVEWRWERSN